MNVVLASRSAMLFHLLLLPLLCFFFQPTQSFEMRAYETHPEQNRPFSLNDCQNLAANHQLLPRWKATYKLCLALFFISRSNNNNNNYDNNDHQPRHDLPGADQQLRGPLKGVALTTDARFQGVADIDTDVLPLVSRKRSSDPFQHHYNNDHDNGDDDEEVVDDIFVKKSTVDDNDDEDDENNDNERGESDDPLLGKGRPQKKWPSLISRAVLRTRRQHSLSINSALVSLADMLRANDYNRQKARQQTRQRTFRQQLLGLGR